MRKEWEGKKAERKRRRRMDEECYPSKVADL